MFIIDLLIHTLTWGFGFIAMFNFGILLGMVVTVMAARKRKRKESEKDI